MSLVLLAAFDFVTLLLEIGLFVVSLFLILLVLVQRGKGGGLTGALGGMGGQSAFGTKAGDVFTRFTVGSAIVWILLCLLTIQLKNRPPQVVKDENAVIESGMGGSGEEEPSTSDDSTTDKGNDAKQDDQSKEDSSKVDTKAESDVDSKTESNAKNDSEDGAAKTDEKSADQPDSK